MKFYQLYKPDNLKPFLKWAGGKTKLIPSITQHLPANIKDYIYVEPFLGAGAVFFYLKPKNAIINDINKELINTYIIIRDNPDELIADLKKHKNEPEYFYYIRNLDITPLTDIQKASRTIFLNKTCFNGLYRVNKSGQFNTSFGKMKNPNIVNEPVIKAVSEFLNTNNIQIENEDYYKIFKKINKKHFVYLDPPYHQISKNFTAYTPGGWNMYTQISLKMACDELNKKNVKFLLSNSSSEFIKNLYKDYDISTVQTYRAISCKKNTRGIVDELLIKNY